MIRYTIFIQIQLSCLVNRIRLQEEIQKTLNWFVVKTSELETGQKLIDGALLPSDGHEIVKVAIRGRNILQRR